MDPIIEKRCRRKHDALTDVFVVVDEVDVDFDDCQKRFTQGVTHRLLVLNVPEIYKKYG